MNRRRAVSLVLLVLLGIAIVGALTPTHPGFDDDAPPPVGAGAAEPPGVVNATLPRRREVRARVGDVVRLTVEARTSDVVELGDMALEQPVDPAVPTQLEFVADRAGTFPVRLRDAGEAVGTLRVDG